MGTSAAAALANIVSQSDYFVPGRVIVVARAPGRLDLMGGIADYSGSLVLEMPLSNATIVAAQATNDETITIRSIGNDDTVEIPLDALANRDYAAAHIMLTADPARRWIAYIAGALVVLGQERGMRIPHGVRILIDSTVPAGKGVASSAALEVATMQALCAIYDEPMDRRTTAMLCQMVENLVVGAPCGVMDQMTSACGEKNRLLALLCQPAQILGHVELPDGLEVWGIDSGIRHEVGGADYGAVRTGAFMGLRVVTELADDDETKWNGYLANMTPDEWRRLYREHVPLTMHGEDFLERFFAISDTVTTVDPERTYAVRMPTEHPILEHARVTEFKRILEIGAQTEGMRMQLGALMYESHESYSACGLGSSGTDRLVEMVRDTMGLYGAKITGGGSGGVVAVLARVGSREVVDEIAERYSRETGNDSTVLGGSSPGASAFGIKHLHSKSRS